jgi:O-antigen ligase
VVVFILSIIQQDRSFVINVKPYHFSVFLFGIFCLFSSIWAINANDALVKGITVLEILICTSVFYWHYQKKRRIIPLLKAIMWAGYLVGLYSIFFYGVAHIWAVIFQGSRLDSSFDNINDLAMLCAMSLIIGVHFFIYEKKSWSILFVMPSFLIIFASGSRKGFVLAVFGIVMVLILKNITKNLLKTIIKIVSLIIIFIILLYWLSTFSLFSGIIARMEGLIAMVTGNGQIDSSSQLRAYYIEIGLRQFWKSPIIGIGIGNSHYVTSQYSTHSTYLHNNFVELLCCGGILGFYLFYRMYIYILYNLFKLRHIKTNISKLMLVIIFLVLMMDYGAVSYYSKVSYFYLMVAFLFIDFLKKEYRRTNKSAVVDSETFESNE